jgi:hypothetical protein
MAPILMIEGSTYGGIDQSPVVVCIAIMMGNPSSFWVLSKIEHERRGVRLPIRHIHDAPWGNKILRLL